MVLDKNMLVTRVGAELEHGLAYAFGVLANLAYYPETNYDNRWAAAFGFADSQTVVTPGPELPNYTRVRSDGVCVFGIAGTTHKIQMLDNIIYCDQVHDNAFGGGWVHSFFRWVANGLIPFIDADLAGRPNTTKLAFTGHSLGGAAAHLLSWYYALQGWDVRNCVVFNSPKVGNSEYAGFSRPFGYWHVVNAYDKVSGLPPRLTFGLTNGFPVFDQDLNEWVATQPMFEIAVPESLDYDFDNAPAARVAGWAPFLDSLSSTGHRLLNETPLQRYTRMVRAHRSVTVAGTAACLTALYVLNLNNHKLDRLLKQLKELYDANNGPLVLNDIWELQRQLENIPLPVQSPTPHTRDFGLVDPGPFMSPTPPASPAVTPTPTPAGSALTSTVFNGTVAVVPAPQFAPTMMRVAEVVLPPGATLPPFFSRERTHWMFRSKDRRMLQKLAKVMQLIEDRDEIALGTDPTSRISTRDTVIDWDDPDQVEAWYAVKEQVATCLAMAFDASDDS